MRAAKLPAFVLILWLGATLLWWGFAFLPLPSAPPEWLAAARAACFGSAESGLPAPFGWALLILGPGSFLVGIFLLWGTELIGSLRSVARSPLGAGILALIVAALIAEGVWVSEKVRAGAAIARWDEASADSSSLPVAYPRQKAAAIDFTLVDQAGNGISLGRLKGKPVILTFVFAHCQTMCPLLVQNIKQALPGAPSSEVLLVTLDPWRDTPSVLASLAQRWDVPKNFHILSSSAVADVLSVVEAYGVPYQRDAKTGDIAHPGLVFLVDPERRLAYTFSNPPPAWIREGLDRLVAETSG